MPDDVTAALASEDPAERLAAARLLLKQVEPPPIAEIRRRKQIETDSWVRAALDRALSHWELGPSSSPANDAWITPADPDDLHDIKALAVQSVTRTVLHEIRPIVGSIETAARRDFGDAYPTSSIASGIQRLRDFLETISILFAAAEAPRVTEFDLVDLIAREIDAAGVPEGRVLVTLNDPLTVHGDPDLLKLALQNAIRNAVEASESAEAPVIVTCGRSQSEAWIVVLDEGVGLPEGATKVWEPGVTRKSKKKHFGWGLPIAKQAMDSLGGSIKLTPRELGGTACEIKWSSESIERIDGEHENTAS